MLQCVAAARSSSGGSAAFAAARLVPGATIAATGWGSLAFAAQHGSVSAVAVSAGLGDGAAVVTSRCGARRRLFGCWHFFSGVCGDGRGWHPCGRQSRRVYPLPPDSE